MFLPTGFFAYDFRRRSFTRTVYSACARSCVSYCNSSIRSTRSKISASFKATGSVSGVITFLPPYTASDVVDFCCPTLLPGLRLSCKPSVNFWRSRIRHIRVDMPGSFTGCGLLSNLYHDALEMPGTCHGFFVNNAKASGVGIGAVSLALIITNLLRHFWKDIRGYVCEIKLSTKRACYFVHNEQKGTKSPVKPAIIFFGRKV